MNDRPLVIAHRGASSYAPENTYAAFDLALRMGAKGFEMDVHLSADGKIVVIHDRTLERTTNGSGAVNQKTLAELLTLDAGSWFGPEFTGERIPLLEDLMRRYRNRAHLHIEIKDGGPDMVREIGRLVRELDMVDQVVIASFSVERVQEVRTWFPEMTSGIIVKELTDTVIKAAREYGVPQIWPSAGCFSPQQAEQLKDLGLAIRVWGVKDDTLLDKAMELKVDGIIVDFPDKALAAVAARS